MSNPIKLRATVTDVLEHGTGVFIVKMKILGRMPKFRAGQFLHLTIDNFNPSGGFWPESRAFSIAAYDDGLFVTIAYSVKGRYTTRMASCLKPGKEVWLKLPYGDFVVGSKSGQDHDVVLVAGGTGISPFALYMQSLDGKDIGSQQVRLYYGARNPKHLLFLDLLERCVEKKLLRVELRLEEGIDSVSLSRAFVVKKGLLDIDSIVDDCADLKEPEFYLSGPPAMINNFKARLFNRGIKRENVRIDEWE